MSTYVVIYDAPRYGVHHFSLRFWNSSNQVKPLVKKPKWVNQLHQKQPSNDLDAVILAINSATASKIVFERRVDSDRSFSKFSLIYITGTYHLFPHQSNFLFCKVSVMCGIWEKAALHKHSMWSSLTVDVLLGNLIGSTLLVHAESVCLWVMNFANDSTNELLRSGCVWLMGVPAGFKLNTELAEVLGMISLNAIQIWSTLWIIAGSLCIYLVKGLAILGILFGITVPAALVRDMIALVTLHISTLQWMISLVYSQQIQALAALWRLFRDRKWNPLRQRLDSYDYTVKQHVVGSLVFTPLLLLLPTTSVFYIFFTMMNSFISLICILIEVTISVIHATPYINVLLCLVRRKRFPSGIWFEIKSCNNSPSKYSLQEDNSSGSSNVLVSILHSNFLSIGDSSNK